jgi:hypothetical protein
MALQYILLFAEPEDQAERLSGTREAVEATQPRVQEPIYTQRKSIAESVPYSSCGHAGKKLTEKARSFPKTRRQGRESPENREWDGEFDSSPPLL